MSAPRPASTLGLLSCCWAGAFLYSAAQFVFSLGTRSRTEAGNMIQLPRKVSFLVVIFFAIVAAPVLAQNGGGWKASSGGAARYDGPPASQVAAASAPAPVPKPPGDVT